MVVTLYFSIFTGAIKTVSKLFSARGYRKCDEVLVLLRNDQPATVFHDDVGQFNFNNVSMYDLDDSGGSE